jgi:hypothetical protein
MARTINRQADFNQITGPLFSSVCSPELDDDQGILINLPEEILIDEPGVAPRVQLAGACQFPYDLLGLRGAFAEKILFVAVNAETHHVHANQFEAVPNPALPPTPEPDEPRPELVIGAYFNPDLSEILGLPPGDAEYLVYAVLGPHRSNMLRVRLRSPASTP